MVRTILSAALLIGASTFAMAQGTGQPGQSSQPGASNNQTQCWDMATNQVRNQAPSSQAGSGSAGSGNTGAGAGGGTTGSGAGSGANIGSGSGSAANRPAGMLNC